MGSHFEITAQLSHLQLLHCVWRPLFVSGFPISSDNANAIEAPTIPAPRLSGVLCWSAFAPRVAREALF